MPRTRIRTAVPQHGVFLWPLFVSVHHAHNRTVERALAFGQDPHA